MLNIKFYSLQTSLETEYTTYWDIQFIKGYFRNEEWIGVDLETEGFDPYTSKILSLQLGNKQIQFVIDVSTISITQFKDILETKNLIFQNGKFDLRFLYRNNIYPNKIYDTYLAEVKLNQGIPDVRKNLQVLEERYCDSNFVDKGNRGLIHKEGFTSRVIKYCAGDVAVLHEIKEKQEIKAKELQMTEAIRLENEFVLALAYTEYCGLYLDPTLWKEKVKKSTQLLIESEIKLNQYILNNNLSKYIDAQLDLFSSERKVNINWNSDKQVKPLFKDLGINITVVEKGEVKESIEAPVLKKQECDFDIIPLYLNYAKYSKDVSTYGLEFLRHINPVTGRIHTSFTQIVDTGRMASGGKQGKIETPNLQNIPADDSRKCFIPQFDNEFVNADYSAQEDIVFVNKCKEPKLIEFYQRPGNPDGHSYVAKLCFPEELKDVQESDVKKLRPDLRAKAKTAKFSVHYGGTGYTIAANLAIDISEGERIENSYYEAFPGIKEYFDKCENEALEKGYILIDQLLGSKFFIQGFEEFKQLQLKYSFDNREYWDTYKIEKEKNSIWYIQEREEVRIYFRWKGLIRRMALNYPIQGSSATITKLACIYFFRWIKESNLINKVLITNIVHDEIMTEQNKELSDLVCTNLKNCMEKAGSYYCPIIPLKAVPQKTNYWKH